MQAQVFSVIGRVATSPLNVLIQGEKGTGKAMIARVIHSYLPIPGEMTWVRPERQPLLPSPRSQTVFLDEIANWEGTWLNRLWGELQKDRTGLRLVSTTSSDLDGAVREGRLPSPLF